MPAGGQALKVMGESNTEHGIGRLVALDVSAAPEGASCFISLQSGCIHQQELYLAPHCLSGSMARLFGSSLGLGLL